MARRPSKHLRTPRPLSTSFTRAESKRDGEWVVQPLVANRSEKDYTCPDCHRVVPAGSAHVVAWPRTPGLGTSSPVDARRHWHTACWNRRR
ncbi:MAG: hypothetical protein Q4F65_05165 [Propionibacteriaceae bacterium]|nr:hypothetical protein [Propionibacteriaceae bacterium]